MLKRTIIVASALAIVAVVGAAAYFEMQEERLTSTLYSSYEDAEKAASPSPAAVQAQPVPAPAGTPPAESPVRVPILVYHSVKPYFDGQTKIQREFDVEPTVFDRQMKYLKDNGYSAVSFDDLADYVEKKAAPPSKPVIISFDDGWQSQYEHALPILEKYGLTATFYIFTNAIGHLNFMTWQQVLDLQKRGMTVGDHSRTHPYLQKIDDPKKLADEIIGSKAVLEEKLKTKVTTFAYPFGKYDDRVVAVVKEAGFRTGRGFFPGNTYAEGDLLTLRCIEATDGFARFVSKITDDAAAAKP